MKSNIEILSEIFKPTSFDCKTEMEDLQIAITLNPDLRKILRCMEIAQEQVKLCNIPLVSNNEALDLCDGVAFANYIEKKWLEYRCITNNEDAWSFKQWLVGK